MNDLIQTLKNGVDIFNTETGSYVWLYADESDADDAENGYLFGITEIDKDEVKEFLKTKTSKDDFYEFAIGGRARGGVISPSMLNDLDENWVKVNKTSLEAWVND